MKIGRKREETDLHSKESKANQTVNSWLEILKLGSIRSGRCILKETETYVLKQRSSISGISLDETKRILDFNKHSLRLSSHFQTQIIQSNFIDSIHFIVQHAVSNIVLK